MTTATLAAPADLRALTDDELLAAYRAGDDSGQALALAEARRRDHRDRSRRRAGAVRAEWHDAAHAQYLAAEAATCGNLVRRDSPVRDGWSLFSGSETYAMAHCSEELANYWLDHPRVTVTAYQRQVSAGRRAERDDYLQAQAQPASEGTTTNDQLGRDEPNRVRRGTGADSEGAQVRSVGAGDVVPAPDAGAQEQERADPAGRVARPGAAVPRVTARQTTTNTTREEIMIGRIVGEAVRTADHAATMARRRQEVADQGAKLGRDLHARTEVAQRAPAALAVREHILGDPLLRDTRKFFRHFALWPSEAALTVATLATAAMHGRDPKTLEPVWEYAFRLMFTASEYGAGKSWFAQLVAQLAPDGEVVLEPTKASLIDEIGDHKTIVVTEADELFASAGRNRGTVAVINGSYEPGHHHTRKSGGKVQRVHLFAHMILDCVDTLLQGTRGDMRGLVSRCIVIRVKMAPDGYRRPRWNADARALAERGRTRLAAWMAQEVAAGIADEIPPIPAGIGKPRRVALYEPLFTVALRADQGDPGGYWSTALADAAYQLESALGLPDEDEDTETKLDAMMASWED